VSGCCECGNELLGSIPWLAGQLLSPCRLFLLDVDITRALKLFSLDFMRQCQ